MVKTKGKLSNFGLGTVQFGLDYGFTKRKTQDEVNDILNVAVENNVTSIIVFQNPWPDISSAGIGSRVHMGDQAERPAGGIGFDFSVDDTFFFIEIHGCAADLLKFLFQHPCQVKLLHGCRHGIRMI